MKITSLTWNIGGGKLLRDGADPSLMASYTIDGLDEIITTIRNEKADIVTLQETEKGIGYDQVEYIANALGFSNFVHDITSESHIDREHKLGHGIISRFPIVQHETSFFNNPHVKVVWEDGRTVSTFDKGYTNCVVDVNGIKLQISTLHLTPFKRFNIDLDSKIGKAMLLDVSNRIGMDEEHCILSGDFNVDSKSLKNILPELFEKGGDEVTTQDFTTPNGRTYDHILYKGLTNTDGYVNTAVLTDHYPVVADFEI